MSRRNISKKRFPDPDPKYNSYLVSLLIQRILKSGIKKTIARNIVNGAFEIIKTKTKEDPLIIFEKAIKNSPIVEVKARRIGGSTYLFQLK